MPHRIFRWIRKRKALILQMRFKNSYLRCRAHGNRFTALPALKAITTISASTRMHRCLYAVGWDRGAEEGWFARGGNMDIWSPSFQSDRVVCQREWMWIPWDCLEYFVTRVFLPPICYHGRNKKTSKKNWAPTTNSSARFPKAQWDHYWCSKAGKKRKSRGRSK
jgi:hypothetical protein